LQIKRLELREENTMGTVPRGNGLYCTVERINCCDRATLPELGAGRPQVDLERMLQVRFLQNWFNLVDQAVEEESLIYR